MKKTLYLALIAIAATTVSCNDFLDTASPSKMTSAVVFEDADMADKTVLGIYDCLTADATYSQYLSITFNCGSDVEFRSFSSSDGPMVENRAFAHYGANANNGQLKNLWTALYACIERANIAIEGIESSTIYTDRNHIYHTDFKTLRAEAIVLRALCYLNLTNHWGNVPFKIEPTASDLSNVYLPKSDRMDIYQTLIGQLAECAKDLPWQQITPERVNQGFARGLAARMALNRAGYEFTTDCRWQAPRADAKEWYAVAAAQCDTVIKSGQYDLEATYFDYFYKQCQRQYSPKESLYEIGFQMKRSSELGYTNGVRFTTQTSTYGYTSQSQVITTPSMFYSYAPGDERRDVSVAYYAYTDISSSSSYPNAVTSNTGVSMQIYNNLHEGFHLNKWSVKWTPADFRAASLANGTKTGTGINFSVMRYSDVLLMFAEADFNAQGIITAEAKEALWKVRKRAVPSLVRADFENYISGKGFQQAVEDERNWEFLGEGQRKFDLIRWGKLPQAIIDMREVNTRIATQWQYDFEFKTTLNGHTRAIPTELYYKYDQNNEDLADINIDYTLDAAPDATYFNSTIGKVWAYNSLFTSSTAQTSLETTLNYWRVTNSGLVDTEGALVAGGRPFQPVPASVIADYNGKISQDYNF